MSLSLSLHVSILCECLYINLSLSLSFLFRYLVPVVSLLDVVGGHAALYVGNVLLDVDQGPLVIRQVTVPQTKKLNLHKISSQWNLLYAP